MATLPFRLQILLLYVYVMILLVNGNEQLIILLEIKFLNE